MKKLILSGLFCYPLLVAAAQPKWVVEIINNCSFAVTPSVQHSYQWDSGSFASVQPIVPNSSVTEFSYPVSGNYQVDDSINWTVVKSDTQTPLANFLFSFTSSAANSTAFPNYLLADARLTGGIITGWYTLFAGANGDAQIKDFVTNSTQATMFVAVTICPTDTPTKAVSKEGAN